MRKNKLKFILTIILIVAITIIYIVYNILIRNNKRKTNEIPTSTKEKVIVNNFRIGIINFDTINPILSKNENVQNVSKLIFEPLFDLNKNFKLEPCLASECSKLNNTTYIIKLVENIQWQNGKKFDSNDVKFTIDYLNENKDKSIYYNKVKNIKELKIIDENTIKILLKEEEEYFEYNLTFPILISNDKDNLEDKNLLGTGMYYISDINNENIILKINTNWWKNEQVKLDTIKLSFHENINNAISEMKIGNIDFIMPTSKNVEEYLRGVSVKQQRYTGREYSYLALNCKDSILKNKEVRQAISYAINKSKIIEEVYNNQYKISNFPLDFGSYLYNENSQRIEYNIEKAKGLLEENGWKYKDGYWNKNGELLKINMAVNEEYKDKVEVAKIIKEQLSEAGIQLDIITYSEKEYDKIMQNKEYCILFASLSHEYSPSLYWYFKDNNLANYNNKEILNNSKKLEEDEESDKIKIMNDIIEKYNDDVPYISLYYDTNLLIYTENLRGEVTPNSYKVFYNINNWYREYDKKK